MTDLRDKLLTLDRAGLVKEADKLGLKVSDAMSRAELITLIEKEHALQEFGELKTLSEHRFLIVGLFFVTLATFILAFETLFTLQSGTNVFTAMLAPIYLVFRGLGGFLIAVALIMIALKTSYQSITPLVRAALIIGAILIVTFALFFMPFPAQWLLP
ncbi:MAG: hypothetical protein ACFE89_08630 [Candidatus Hodarchaeota archaeon]